ncbi:MAG TPA: hypothetical protein VMH82_14975 [Myxococcota bacterium]|nr:hypothetical protein [Myxococcota bacterium]
MSRLEILDGKSWQAFLEAPAAVLVLGKSGCDACSTWASELERFLDGDQRWQHVRFGKLLLDTPGLVSFKRANPWVAELDALPFTVIYRDGQRSKDFAGGGVERLVTRLERALAPAP